LLKLVLQPAPSQLLGAFLKMTQTATETLRGTELQDFKDSWAEDNKEEFEIQLNEESEEKNEEDLPKEDLDDIEEEENEEDLPKEDLDDI
jgi:hypothetical protein